MGLFDNIRSKTDSTTARLLFGAVVVVFVFSFIGGGMGGRTATYATVNGSRITSLDLQKAVRTAQRQMQISSMNEDEQQEFENNILEQLIVQRAVMDKASKLGVEVSDDEISLYILSNPGFNDATGEHSPELYEQAIKQLGYGSKAKFEESVREDLIFTKLRQQVVGSVYVSEQEATEQAKLGLSAVNLEWIRLSQSSIILDISIEDVQAELEANKTEIEAQYNADLPFKYQKGERVSFQRITLPFTVETKDAVQSQASNIETQLASGGDFSTLLMEANPGSINNGLITDSTREQLESDISEALFSMEINSTQVVTTDNAIQILKLIEKKPAETVSFEVAGLEIAKSRLEAARKSAALSEKAIQVLSEWKNGFSEESAALYPIQSEDNVSLVEPKISGLGNNPQLFAALADVKSIGWLETPFPTLGGVVLVKITDVQTPTAEQLSERTKLETMRLKVQRERMLWEAFQANARATATVDEIWKNSQQ